MMMMFLPVVFVVVLMSSSALGSRNRPCLVIPAESTTTTNMHTTTGQRPSICLTDNIDTTIDYRRCSFAVTSVRDQGECGSCWAFSASESMEGQLGMNGMNITISPQQFVDCVQEDYGCGGGWPDDAISYAENKGGG